MSIENFGLWIGEAMIYDAFTWEVATLGIVRQLSPSCANIRISTGPLFQKST